tara:strand:+ start:1443 stop:1628 length:186 start_codon:yes stop_codon:yes gene_type:complete
MPGGKPAGVACIQLDDEYRCRIFGHPDRPAVCAGFKADQEVCGDTQVDALRIIGWWEAQTG